jgi:predicted xylose isomerase-like sugar epimerase
MEESLLGFHEWEESEKAKARAIAAVAELEDNKKQIESPSNDLMPSTYVCQSAEMNKITMLCRVCNSSGLISINTNMNRTNMKFKSSSDWAVNTDIATMISEISNEAVRNSFKHTFFSHI